MGKLSRETPPPREGEPMGALKQGNSDPTCIQSASTPQDDRTQTAQRKALPRAKGWPSKEPSEVCSYHNKVGEDSNTMKEILASRTTTRFACSTSWVAFSICYSQSTRKTVHGSITAAQSTTGSVAQQPLLCVQHRPPVQHEQKDIQATHFQED